MPTIQTAWQSVVTIQSHQAAEEATKVFRHGNRIESLPPLFAPLSNNLISPQSYRRCRRLWKPMRFRPILTRLKLPP